MKKKLANLLIMKKKLVNRLNHFKYI